MTTWVKSLTDIELERLQAFWEKMREAKVKYCDLHSLEYLEQDGCYACEDEKRDFDSYVKKRNDSK